MLGGFMFDDAVLADGAEVVCTALAKYCMKKGVEPDIILMHRAIHFYNLGNDTSDKLLEAITLNRLN
jgi:hypothetical protein